MATSGRDETGGLWLAGWHRQEPLLPGQQYPGHFSGKSVVFAGGCLVTNCRLQDLTKVVIIRYFFRLRYLTFLWQHIARCLIYFFLLSFGTSGANYFLINNGTKRNKARVQVWRSRRSDDNRGLAFDSPKVDECDVCAIDSPHHPYCLSCVPPPCIIEHGYR